jgi:dUTP pyrophosphatase
MNAEIKIKKLSENAIIPTYGSDEAAGADLYACLNEPLTIEPHETKLVPTAIAMQILPGFAGFIFARSGLASKRNLAPANKVGVIDSDYRGEIMVALHNHGTTPQTIEHGERIAQIVFLPYLAAKFVERKHLSATKRGSGGFGSTGRK